MFATALKSALAVRGLAPSEFADLIGVDASAVRKWLRGSQLPRKDMMEDILQKLGADDSTRLQLFAGYHDRSPADFCNVAGVTVRVAEEAA